VGLAQIRKNGGWNSNLYEGHPSAICVYDELGEEESFAASLAESHSMVVTVLLSAI